VVLKEFQESLSINYVVQQDWPTIPANPPPYMHIQFTDHPVQVEVLFIGVPDVTINCWIVFQILTE
jgi:hypothetical protein